MSKQCDTGDAAVEPCLCRYGLFHTHAIHTQTHTPLYTCVQCDCVFDTVRMCVRVHVWARMCGLYVCICVCLWVYVCVYVCVSHTRIYNIHTTRTWYTYTHSHTGIHLLITLARVDSLRKQWERYAVKNDFFFYLLVYLSKYLSLMVFQGHRYVLFSGLFLGRSVGSIF